MTLDGHICDSEVINEHFFFFFFRFVVVTELKLISD